MTKGASFIRAGNEDYYKRVSESLPRAIIAKKITNTITIVRKNPLVRRFRYLRGSMTVSYSGAPCFSNITKSPIAKYFCT